MADETVPQIVSAGVATMVDVDNFSGKLAPLAEAIELAMSQEVQACIDEGISVHDADAIRPRILAAKDAVLERYNMAVEEAMRKIAAEDETRRRKAFDEQQAAHAAKQKAEDQIARAARAGGTP